MRTEDGSFGNILYMSTNTANLKMYNEMHIIIFFTFVVTQHQLLKQFKLF